MTRLTVLAAAAAVLAACSPYAYNKEIETFAKSVTALTDSSAQLSADIAAEPDKAAFWKAVAPSASVGFSKAFCQTAVPRPTPGVSAEGLCRVEVDETSMIPSAGDLNAQKKLTTVFRPLAAYAKALGAVANAEDSTSFGAAASDLAQRAGGLIGAVPGAPGPATTVALRIITRGVQLNLERARLKQLRASVEAVNKHMSAVHQMFGDGLDAVRQNRIQALVDRMDLVTTAINQLPATAVATRSDYVEELIGLAAKVRALQSLDATAAPSAMVSTHAALATALANPEPDINDVFEQLSAFVDLAADFNKAIKGE